jgi:hypothetical protein
MGTIGTGERPQLTSAATRQAAVRRRLRITAKLSEASERGDDVNNDDGAAGPSGPVAA